LSFNFDWVEDLPFGCPPTEAVIPSGKTFYRLVSKYPPSEKDFYPHIKLYPNKSFNDICMASGLSISDSIDGCQELKKLPNLKSKKIAKIILNNKSGVILKTTSRRYHFTWWVAKSFNPVDNCELIHNG
jgi:hypothetical protein